MKNHEGEEGPVPEESDSDFDQAPADGLDADGGVKRKYGGGARYVEHIFYPNYYNLLQFSVTLCCINVCCTLNNKKQQYIYVNNVYSSFFFYNILSKNLSL